MDETTTSMAVPTSTNGTDDEAQIPQNALFYGKTKYVRAIESAISLLYNKDSPKRNIVIWFEDDAIKIVSDHNRVSQVIVFLAKDLFMQFYLAPQATDSPMTIQIPLFEFLKFLEIQFSNSSNLTIAILGENMPLRIGMDEPMFRAEATISAIQFDPNEINIFNFKEYETVVNIDSPAIALLPSFTSLDWTHQYITIKVSKNENWISFYTESIADSIYTKYPLHSFNFFECSKDFEGRYKLSHFVSFRKALEKSKSCLLIINEMGLLYLECSLSDEKPQIEVAFYISPDCETGEIEEMEMEETNGDTNTSASARTKSNRMEME